jgi:hypothetical protein
MMTTTRTLLTAARRAALLTGGALIALLVPAVAQAQIGAKFVPTITTAAGSTSACVPASYSTCGDGGPATAAKLNAPQSATYDAVGNLYIADTGDSTIRRVDAVTGIITTVAGNGTAGLAGDGGLATAAELNKPYNVAFDPAGNLYIADYSNCAVRKVTIPGGMISTVLGTLGSCVKSNATYTTGVAANGTLDPVISIAIDASYDIFLLDATQNLIFEYKAASGMLFQAACVGTNGKNINDDGMSASLAACGTMGGIALDNQGNLYLSDAYNDVVRRITLSTGIIQTIAGTYDANGTNAPTPVPGNTGDGGPALAATLNKPLGIYPDQYGNVFIASNLANTVRVVNQNSMIINAYAGTTTAGYTGDTGPATLATLNSPYDARPDALADRVAIADTKNNVIRAVSIGNVFLGTNVGGTSATQTVSAQASTAGTVSSFLVPTTATDFTSGTPTGCPGALVANAACSVPVNFTPTLPGLRTQALTLTDSTGAKAIVGLAGIGLSPAVNFTPGNLSTFDAAATAALLKAPSGMALDAAGNVYVADTNNNEVRKLAAGTGTATVFAGTGVAGFLGDGGPPSSAQLSGPQAVTVDAAGNVYIADTGNNRIRVVSAATGNISTLAGGTTAGSTGDGGLASAALLSGPQDVAVDPAGNVYIADTGSNKVRVVNVQSGYILTVAGTGVAGTPATGLATGSPLNAPGGVAADNRGDVYLSDTGNNVVREVVGGQIMTVAGNGTAATSGDGGPATAASINGPGHLGLDAAGDVYVAGTAGNRVREVSAATGFIATIAGTGTAGVSANGLLATNSALSGPKGVKIDSLGNVYVVDTGNNRIAEIPAAGETVAFGSQARGTTAATQTVSLQNYGSLPLTLTGLAVTPASFAQTTGAASDCTATTVLAAGASCQLRLTFTPAAGGAVTGTVTITDNALNKAGSTQVISLTGTGVVVPQVITITAGNNQTTTPQSTFPVNLTVKVTDNSNFASPGTVVTFTAPASGAGGTFATTGTNTATATTASDGTASVTLVANLNKGMFTVTAAVAGITTSASFTETIAGNVSPIITLTVPTTTPTYGTTVTVSATLSPTTSNGQGEMGTMTFLDNGTAVCTAVPVANAAASCMFIPNAGTNSITATYTGDANFGASTTVNPSTFTVNPLAITATTSNVSIPYGTAIPTITGTLTGVLTKDAGNVTVTFKPSTTATYPDVGTYALTPTLAGSAAGNYTVTATGSPTLTITQAATATSVTLAPNPVFQGQSETISGAVTTTSLGNVPTGMVTVTLTPTTGTAIVLVATLSKTATYTISNTAIPAGSYSVTAVYSGNLDYATSSATSQTLAVTPPDFALSATPTAVTVQQGARGYVTLTVTPNQILTGNVTFSCPNIPATFSCTFAPTVLATTGTTPVTSFLTIATSGATSAMNIAPGNESRTVLAMMALPGILLLGMMSVRTRRKSLQSLARLGVIVLSIGVSIGFSGCGNGVPEPRSPIGTTNITVQATGGPAAQMATHTVMIAVTVTAPTSLN